MVFLVSISGQIVNLLNKDIKVSASIDFMPRLNEKEVETKLMGELKDNFKKSISNVLKKNYPNRIIDLAMDVLEIDPMTKVNQLKASDRKKIVSFLKGMDLKIIGFESLDPRTMSSRLIDGLFFAGEMIDLDGDTGGYNLQEAFSTGYLAGESAAKYILD